MKRLLRAGCAQINSTVGDLIGNSKKIIEYVKKAKEFEIDIISFPELALTGYPPEDLLFKNDFIENNLKIINEIASQIYDIVAIIGFVSKSNKKIYNSAAIIYNGEIKGTYNKIHLPNYGVFDEKRYFATGKKPLIFKYGKIIFGVTICEDIWVKNSPVLTQKEAGANLIFNISASPYHYGKIKEREEIVRNQAKRNSIPVVYTNLVGGQDELVFDGSSLIIDEKGNIIVKAESFKEDLIFADFSLDVGKKSNKKNDTVIITNEDKILSKKRFEIKKSKQLQPVEEIYQALILGLKDYVEKNGFKKVVLGLSGGIDSALVATIAKDALGSENVTGVFMPTRYSSDESRIDAEKLAKNLNINFLVIPIDEIFEIYLKILQPYFKNLPADITEENIQARIRGNILMALSNKFGWLVLTTGNKSEMSTGYATLYGDMAGGFAVIKDVFKTLVYQLAKYRNSISKVIPDNILIKEPTAELRENQKDRDTLPDYEILDKILELYIEKDKSIEEIVANGFEKELVIKVLNMVDRSEYKRRQAPPGIKITPKSFGKDRRIPITNKYKFVKSIIKCENNKV